MKDCSADPDDCPAGHVCCLSPSDASYLTHCMPEETFSDLGPILCLN
jgi:hypothetical protein